MDNINLNLTDDEKISKVIYAFVCFELIMLFQTSYHSLGLIATTAVSALIMLCYVWEFRSIRLDTASIILLMYTVLSILTTLVYRSFDSKFLQYLVYVVLFVVLSSLKLNGKEKNILLGGFVISGIFYSVLVIYSRTVNAGEYYHSKISLFGTGLDPNYIGLPLIVAFSILFFYTLNGNKKIIKTIGLFILAMAILLTSSRGNFFSLSVCVVLNVIIFLHNRDISHYKKVFIICGVILAILLFYLFAESNYSDFLHRMISFSDEDSDNGRFEIWKQAVEVWLTRPLFGRGFEAQGRLNGVGAHNTYIQLLCDSGVSGFALFISFLCFIFFKSFRHNKNLFIAFIGLLVHSFFLGSIASRCFWAVLIMINLCVNHIDEEQPDYE